MSILLLQNRKFVYLYTWMSRYIYVFVQIKWLKKKSCNLKCVNGIMVLLFLLVFYVFGITCIYFGRVVKNIIYYYNMFWH